jgi:hypothetical protein
LFENVLSFTILVANFKTAYSSKNLFKKINVLLRVSF